jgi:hypothetical protein
LHKTELQAEIKALKHDMRRLMSVANEYVNVCLEQEAEIAALADHLDRANRLQVRMIRRRLSKPPG